MHAAQSRTAISPYTLLGVTAASNPEEVRAAYKKRALETHPDKGGDPEEFLRVKQAYEAITSGKAALPGAPPGRPPCRPPRFNPGMADPTYGVPLSERLARKRPPQSMEEELAGGSSSIPGGAAAKRVAERMAAGGVAQARQSSSLSARVSAQATAAKSKAPAEVSVVKLWEKLTKLPPKDRATAISNLEVGLRAKLSKYLETRKTGRVGGFARLSPSPEAIKKTEEVKPGSDSDSGESSSSESSGSSRDSNENDVGGSGQRAVVTGQKHLHRVVGKTSREVG